LFATTKQGQTIEKVQKIVKNARTIAAPKIKKLKANKVKGKKASVTVNIKKVKGAKRYVVEYSTNSKFRDYDSVSTKKTTVTLKKLKKNKKYYIRVYATKYDDRGDFVYSKYSKKKSIKTKK
jgi:regulator of sigma D